MGELRTETLVINVKLVESFGVQDRTLFVWSEARVLNMGELVGNDGYIMKLTLSFSP